MLKSYTTSFTRCFCKCFGKKIVPSSFTTDSVVFPKQLKKLLDKILKILHTYDIVDMKNFDALHNYAKLCEVPVYRVFFSRTEPMREKSVLLPNFKRSNLVQMVFDALKENILTGKFKGGERLPTQEILARQFGVSRTVMREALNKLSSLGLIESQQGRGTFVCSPDAQTVMEPMFHAFLLDDASICELMEVRYYLEKIIARLAAKRITPVQIDALRENVLDMEQSVGARNLEMFAEKDLVFHLMLAEISANNILRRILTALREMMTKFFEDFSHTPGIAERSVRYHQKILQAILHKDPEEAERAMQEHILDIIAVLREKYNMNLEI